MTLYIIGYLILGLMVAAAVANESFQPEWRYYSKAMKFRVTVYLAMTGLLWPAVVITGVLWSLFPKARTAMWNWMAHGKLSAKETGQ